MAEETIRPNTGAAIDFLMWYAGNDPLMLTAIVPDGGGVTSLTARPETEALKLREWIDARQGRENIYFMVNAPIKPMSGSGVKAKKADVGLVRAFHVDLDPRAGEDLTAERERAERVLRNYKPAPSFIIDSGNGFQGFWMLKEPVDIEGDEARAAEFEAYNQQIALVLTADNCHNIDRIMRLPGTVNVPDAKKRKKGRVPVLSRLVYRDEDDPFRDIAKFTAAPRARQAVDAGTGIGSQVRVNIPSGNLPQVDLDKLPEKVNQKAKEIIVQGDDPDDPTRFPSRSEAVFYVCCELLRADVPPETIAAILLDRDLGISASIREKSRPGEYAARQIARAQEQIISPHLCGLNDKHAVIEDLGGKCVVISEVFDEALKRHRLSRQSFENFRNRYSHLNVDEGKKQYKLGAWWLAHPRRRQYETLVFAPGRETPNAYNMWKGFACEALPGSCELFLKHVEENICAGNDLYFQYLLDWMARAVQHPDSPGEVAVVLRGRQGTGKSFFAKAFGNLWGRHFLHISNSKHLVGSFNAHLRDCVVLFADEAFYAGDKQHESILKTLVTEETLIVEGKGVDAEVAPNYVHMLMGSNNKWVVPAGSDERRFFVLDVGDARMQDSAYFARIRRELDNGGREALLHFLMTRDIKGFDVRKFPRTGALQEQKQLSWSDEESWWYEKLIEGRLLDGLPGWPSQIIKEALHVDYTNWMNNLKRNKIMAPQVFGRFLSRVMPGEYPIPTQKWAQKPRYNADGEPENMTERVSYYEVATLDMCREHFDDIYGGPWPWPNMND